MLHKPVLKTEVITNLAPRDCGLYVDCTFGAGGHSRAILEAADCSIIAFDRDHLATSVWQNEFHNTKVVLHNMLFSLGLITMADKSVDGILIDLGVSSMQLDNQARGFSFMQDAPLDMRMGHCITSAKEIVNEYSQSELADLLFYYGDEHDAYRISSAIVRYRATKPIETTLELANIVRRAARNRKKYKIDKATKSFMAIRMVVNDELTELHEALQHGCRILKLGGKLLVISFNASEDKILKNFTENIRNQCYNDEVFDGSQFKIWPKIKPGIDEIADNPRSRSAGLRVIERLS